MRNLYQADNGSEERDYEATAPKGQASIIKLSDLMAAVMPSQLFVEMLGLLLAVHIRVFGNTSEVPDLSRILEMDTAETKTVKANGQKMRDDLIHMVKKYLKRCGMVPKRDEPHARGNRVKTNLVINKRPNGVISIEVGMHPAGDLRPTHNKWSEEEAYEGIRYIEFASHSITLSKQAGDWLKELKNSDGDTAILRVMEFFGWSYTPLPKPVPGLAKGISSLDLETVTVEESRKEQPYRGLLNRKRRSYIKFNSAFWMLPVKDAETGKFIRYDIQLLNGCKARDIAGALLNNKINPEAEIKKLLVAQDRIYLGTNKKSRIYFRPVLQATSGFMGAYIGIPEASGAILCVGISYDSVKNHDGWNTDSMIKDIYRKVIVQKPTDTETRTLTVLADDAGVPDRRFKVEDAKLDDTGKPYRVRLNDCYMAEVNNRFYYIHKTIKWNKDERGKFYKVTTTRIYREHNRKEYFMGEVVYDKSALVDITPMWYEILRGLYQQALRNAEKNAMAEYNYHEQRMYGAQAPTLLAPEGERAEHVDTFYKLIGARKPNKDMPKVVVLAGNTNLRDKKGAYRIVDMLPTMTTIQWYSDRSPKALYLSNNYSLLKDADSILDKDGNPLPTVYVSEDDICNENPSKIFRYADILIKGRSALSEYPNGAVLVCLNYKRGMTRKLAEVLDAGYGYQQELPTEVM